MLHVCLTVMYTTPVIHLTHIPTQQRNTYDRRTSRERLRGAVSALGKSTLCQLAEWSDEEVDDDEEDAPSFGVGDIIAVVEEASTKERPQITNKKEVLLAHMEPICKDGEVFYRLVVGTDTWSESFSALVHPIDAVFNRKQNMYVLQSDPVDIHLVVKK